MANPQAVIVLAAGQGTRMKSNLPKVLHPLGGISLLRHALNAAQATRAKQLCVVVRHQRDKVVEHLKEFFPQALISDQDEIPGTGRAVWCGLQTLDQQAPAGGGTILVTSGDVPLLTGQTLLELVERHQAEGAVVTVVSTIADDPTGYGRIVKDAQGAVQAIVEHRDATAQQRQIKEINAGIYAFDKDFLREVLPTLGSDNDQGEIYLTDTVAAAVAAGKKVCSMVLEDTWQAEGCNDRAQLAALEKIYRQRLCEKWMKAGVAIVDPDTTYIEASVELAPDCRLEPGTHLKGNTSVAQGAVIGTGSVLENTTVSKNAVILHSFLGNVNISEGQTVGPFAVLP